MSQKKVLLYSPDGKEEGWYMENEAPAGWSNQPPETEQPEPAGDPDPVEGDVQPGEGDGTLKGSDPEVPEHTGGLTDVGSSEPEAAE
jgi:hypothetical protein